MKPTHLKLALILILGMFSTFLSAQTIQKLGQHRVGSHTYTVSKYGNKGRISVQEKSNVITRVRDNSHDLTNIEFPSVSSKETVNSAFIKVLGKERIKELLPERHVLLILHYNTGGKTVGVEFILNNDTGLTLKEINKLTKFIEENVTFNIPSDTKIRSELCTPMMQVIKFKKLLYNEN